MKYRRIAGGALVIALLGGCAGTPLHSPRGPDDPLKPINEKIFVFNKGLDRLLLKPAALAYTHLTPLPLRRGVSDFFGNLADVGVVLNESLQGRIQPALLEAARFVVNSTLGVFGLIDVASPMGLTAHSAGFGETLAVWGVPSGPYLVLPLFGPTDLRGSLGLGIDAYTNPVTYLSNSSAQWSLYALQTVDTRSHYLHQSFLIQIASDGNEYDFVRSAFWQKQRALIASRRQ